MSKIRILALKILFNEVCRNKISLHFTHERTYCHIPERQIYINYEDFSNADVCFIFDVLHEVGHIKTNTDEMKRCQQEYTATVYAIEQMKRYDLTLPKQRKEEYQDYIWKWREAGIKHKGKNMPTKKQLTLTW